ncbi:endonuclease-reverse transcriptase [Plakobranchus ocellatus]|uniref:Endonuclease-reverse transcriptase n=1 Tax=Plakobranchus ocellatus TaxID=259542 RepID=A0AAV3YVC5_9GAST|nr:endonuclease-reverse transcriptase [Plakobranchus ocellatus]
MVQAGGEATMDMLLLICNKILQTGVWPKPWTQSLVITLPKKGNLKLCQNYCTISLISHLSKVMLKVILNGLKPEAENIIAEEQAGFRPDANKYSVLKRALLKAFGKSQAQRDNELLNLNGLGDRKPTALLRKINALNEDPQSLKRALFLSNLPADIRSILAVLGLQIISNV